MSCPKRPYKFLGIFKDHKPHEWRIKRVGKFMRYLGNDYKVLLTCDHCGLSNVRHFVSGEELMKEGYTLEQIKEFDGIEF